MERVYFPASFRVLYEAYCHYYGYQGPYDEWLWEVVEDYFAGRPLRDRRPWWRRLWSALGRAWKAAPAWMWGWRPK